MRCDAHCLFSGPADSCKSTDVSAGFFADSPHHLTRILWRDGRAGRLRLIRNQMYPQGYRGFESLSLRHVFQLCAPCRSEWAPSLPSEASRRIGASYAPAGAPQLRIWRDDRVVEGARLESVCTRKGTAGSNPALSARFGLIMAVGDGDLVNPARPGMEQR